MSTVKIKHKEYEIIQDLSLDNFIAERKGKQFLLTKYDLSSEQGDKLAYCLKRLSSTGIKMPRLICADKKSGYIVREYVDGELVMNYMAREDLNEDLYRQLFLNDYMARMNRISLSYDLDKWMIADNTLYFVGETFEPFKEETALTKKSLRLWFKTREFVEFLGKNGIKIDKNRLKDEYSTNKEMVLMTCKYYR